MEQEKRVLCPCAPVCPMKEAMLAIGGKWKLNLLCAVAMKQPVRFNDLKRSVSGISNTVLANCLRELEADGLVCRQEYLEVPVRVEYSITEDTRALLPILRQLAQWQRERKKE